VNEDLQVITAWRVAIGACFIGVASNTVALLTSPSQKLATPLLTLLRSGQLGLCLVLLGVLMVRPRSYRLSLFIFALALAPFFPILFFADQRLAALGGAWVPFLRQKLGVFVVALLAPGEVWVSGTLIGLLALQSVVEYYALGLRTNPYMPIEEPWFTVIIAGIGLVLLIHRLHRFAVERELVRAQAESRRVEELARMSLAVRDLANTPLQTLELALGLLRLDNAPAALVERMDRALAKLRQLNRLLAGYEANLRWTARDVSIDGGRILTAQPPLLRKSEAHSL
jgi:hypothetical protein